MALLLIARLRAITEYQLGSSPMLSAGSSERICASLTALFAAELKSLYF